MKMIKFTAPIRVLFSAFAGMLLAGSIAAANASTEYKMTTPIAPGVATPDTLETSIGTLHLSDGVSKTDTVALGWITNCMSLLPRTLAFVNDCFFRRRTCTEFWQMS